MEDTNLLQRINELEKKVAMLEQQINVSTSTNSVSQQKPLSLKEFIILKKPSDDVKKTLTIGYFLEKFEDFTSFNTEDLLKGYEKAKEKKPLNINDKVNMNIKNGHMAEAADKKDGKKAWYITNSGEFFLESNFKLNNE